MLKLSKTHSNDAIAITYKNKCSFKEAIAIPTIFKFFNKKCIAEGNYRQTRGGRSEQVLHTGKLFGFRKFDKVLYKGKLYFIQSLRFSGYFTLMDVLGNTVNLKPMPKHMLCHRLEARKSWIISMESLNV